MQQPQKPLVQMKSKSPIFEVEETGKDTWEVKYQRKINAPANGYLSITVEKEKSERYIGSKFYSNPAFKMDETF